MSDQHKVETFSCKDVEGVDHDGVEGASIGRNHHQRVVVNRELDRAVQDGSTDDPEAVFHGWFDLELGVWRVDFTASTGIGKLLKSTFSCSEIIALNKLTFITVIIRIIMYHSQ